MGFEKVLSVIKPPRDGASEEEVRNWRYVVSASIFVLVIHILWSAGALFGFTGFAFADDVDSKIEEAIAPIEFRLDSIETAQTVQSGFLKTLVMNDFARLIRNELRARCASTDTDEKIRINAAIDVYQDGYEQAAGEKYDEPDCEDL